MLINLQKVKSITYVQQFFLVPGYKWVHSSAYSSIPPDAVIGGNDSDGAMMYVGRSFHNGDMLVAKILPLKHISFVSWRGEEIPKDHFEVLCGQSLVWRHCYDHMVPENAVECGKTSLGQSVYIGRGHYEGSLTVGKVSSVHRALFIPFGGAERRLETYEILVDERTTPGWAIPSATPPPPPPPLSEKPYSPWDVKPPLSMPPPPMSEKPYPPWDDKPPVYTPMPQPPLSYAPMPAVSYQPPPTSTPAASYQPPPISKPAASYQPPPISTPAVSYQPPGISTPAVSYRPPTNCKPAETYQPPTFITPAVPYEPPPPYGSTPSMYNPLPQPTHDMWVSTGPSYTPTNAVHAGHDTDMSQIFVSRAFHDGDLVPGKAIPSRGCAYISFAGQEIPKSNYEILVGHNYHWVHAQDGNVAPGAVEAGRTTNGEPLFVGRAHYNGSLTPGKIQQSHQCLYIAFGGCERRINHYEVLVRRDEFYREHPMKMHY